MKIEITSHSVKTGKKECLTPVELGEASLRTNQPPVCGWCDREMQPKADQPTVFATLYVCPSGVH